MKQLTGLQKQDAYLTKVYSLPLFCPSCKGMHSYIEARGSNDWTKDFYVKCPVTEEPLVHQMSLFGEQFFSLLPVQNVREMTKEEEAIFNYENENSDEAKRH